MSMHVSRICALTVSLAIIIGTFPLGGKSLSRSDFFSFGESAGDLLLFRNDDDFTPIMCPSVPYPLFDKDDPCFYVSVQV